MVHGTLAVVAVGVEGTMSVPRRSFFAALLAPIAALAIPRAIEVSTRKPPTLEPPKITPVAVDDIELIHDAMIIVGIICPGQSLSAVDMDVCRRTLAAMRYGDNRTVDVYSLAVNLMPFYRRTWSAHAYVEAAHTFYSIPSQLKVWPAEPFYNRGWANETLSPGDKITIAGVYSVNPKTADQAYRELNETIDKCRYCRVTS